VYNPPGDSQAMSHPDDLIEVEAIAVI